MRRKLISTGFAQIARLGPIFWMSRAARIANFGQEEQTLLWVSAGSYMARFSSKLEGALEQNGRRDDST
jgi:hypothetical protein